MRLIQPILLALSLFAASIYLKFFRSVLVDRLILLAIFLLQILAIIFPDATSDIAQTFGVGRGTDMLFYLFASSSIFVFIILYGKLLTSDAKITAVVRAMAIKDAHKGQ